MFGIGDCYFSKISCQIRLFHKILKSAGSGGFLSPGPVFSYTCRLFCSKMKVQSEVLRFSNKKYSTMTDTDLGRENG